MNAFEEVKGKYEKAILHQYERAIKRSDAGGNGALTVNELKGVTYYTEALEKVEASEVQ